MYKNAKQNDGSPSESEGDDEFPENRVQKKNPSTTNIKHNVHKSLSRQQEPVYGRVASAVGGSVNCDQDSDTSLDSSFSETEQSESEMSASKEGITTKSLEQMAKMEFIQSKEMNSAQDTLIKEKTFNLGQNMSKQLAPLTTSPVNDQRKLSPVPSSFRMHGSASHVKTQPDRQPSTDQSDESDDEENETEGGPPTNPNHIEGRNELVESSSSKESLVLDDDEYYKNLLGDDPDVGTVEFKDLSKLIHEYGGHDYMGVEYKKQDARDEEECLKELYNMDQSVMDFRRINQIFYEMKLERKRKRLMNRQPILSKYTDAYGYDFSMYNAVQYENLKVTPDIKELFQYITQYSYEQGLQACKIEVKLKPFLPEFYPSVGDIDGFLKVIHKEIQNDDLGIKSLDEPTSFQSDPSVLDLRLRALAKQNSAKAVVIKKVENVGKNTKIIENWIKDISDLHRSKPSPSVHYSKPMPDIDLLLQEWPAEMEELLKGANFPEPALECDLNDYCDIICNLLDIPIYKSRIQSLHVLCTLYSTQKHFSQYGATNNTEVMPVVPSTSIRYGESAVDQLQLN